MMKRVMIIGILLALIAVNIHGRDYSSDWKVNGISPDGSLMIVYKSLAPLSLKIEEPKKMVIPKSIKTFKYTQITRSQPLKVVAETKYDTTINNQVGKEIIKAIYNSVKFSFESKDGFGGNTFRLDYIPQNVKNQVREENNEINKYIEGKAFFTNISGNDPKDEVEIVFEDNIASGVLSARTYIDAEFKVPEETKLLGGELYSGTIRIKAEFSGKNSPVQ